MVDSSHHVYDQVRFTISERGVENSADEEKMMAVESSESEW
jgi:hypothetical protein